MVAKLAKDSKEWFVDAPWGKIAVVAWGNPANPPILMVHGYVDTAATFIPLIGHLPDTYYYVAFDFPGHGKSHQFPEGPLLTHIHFIEVIKRVVDHMGWKKFVTLGHSLGCLICSYYNYISPGKITKMVNIDFAPPFLMNFYTSCMPLDYIKHFYLKYYEDRYFTKAPPKIYEYDQIIKTLAEKRNISISQAEVVLSRSLVPAGDGKYRLSWDRRMIGISAAIFPEETQLALITTHSPLTLNILASEYRFKGIPPLEQEAFVSNIVEKIRGTIPGSMVTIEGRHDVHITNPKDVAKLIVDFLNKNIADNIILGATSRSKL